MNSQQEYLYLIRPTRPEMLSAGPTPAEQELIGQHFAYLQDLTARGVVILAGRTQTTGPDSFGIIIFSAPDEAAAQDIVANDPAVRQGVMHATLYPYRIALLQGRPEVE
jgi:uncharacterized protein YciI